MVIIEKNLRDIFLSKDVIAVDFGPTSLMQNYAVQNFKNKIMHVPNLFTKKACSDVLQKKWDCSP